MRNTWKVDIGIVSGGEITTENIRSVIWGVHLHTDEMIKLEKNKTGEQSEENCVEYCADLYPYLVPGHGF